MLLLLILSFNFAPLNRNPDSAIVWGCHDFVVYPRRASMALATCIYIHTYIYIYIMHTTITCLHSYTCVWELYDCRFLHTIRVRLQIFNRWEIYFSLMLKSKELSVANYFFDSSIAVLQQKKTNKLHSSCGVEKISWTFNLLISKKIILQKSL